VLGCPPLRPRRVVRRRPWPPVSARVTFCAAPACAWTAGPGVRARWLRLPRGVLNSLPWRFPVHRGARQAAWPGEPPGRARAPAGRAREGARRPGGAGARRDAGPCPVRAGPHRRESVRGARGGAGARVAGRAPPSGPGHCSRPAGARRGLAGGREASPVPRPPRGAAGAWTHRGRASRRSRWPSSRAWLPPRALLALDPPPRALL